MLMKEKFIKKYMRMARQVGVDSNPCYSRQIGVIIVDPITNRILGTGYNGPPKGTPHCTEESYLRDYFWPLLTDEEKESIRLEVGGLTLKQINCEHDFTGRRVCMKCGIYHRDLSDGKTNYYTRDAFAAKYADCQTCPRRLVKAASGERQELCSCQHAERNAITNSGQSLLMSTMFAYCGIPCIQCAGAIINSHITELHCLDGDHYLGMEQSKWLLEQARINLVMHKKEEFNETS